MLGPQELILVLVIAVTIFVPKLIPEIMGGLANGFKSFKMAVKRGDTAGSAALSHPSDLFHLK
jgi:TatA/E family protein of Tat protein translocase